MNSFENDPKKALLYPNEWRPREVFYGFVYVPLFSIYGEIFNGERNSYGHAESLEPGEDCVITTNKVHFRPTSGLISGLIFDSLFRQFSMGFLKWVMNSDVQTNRYQLRYCNQFIC